MFDIASATAEAAENNPQKIDAPATIHGLEVHIDGDYLAYYASGNDDTPAGQARINALELIEAFRSQTGADTVVVHSTATGSQKGERYLIATVKPYQGQRAGSGKPKNHDFLQDWLQTYEGHLFRAKVWESREADDGIAACAAYAVGKPPGYIAIATADKDMRMLPGLHITWRPGTEGRRILTRVHPGDYDVVGEDGKQYGLKWFFIQMLMGDTADNIPGLPGVASKNGSFKTVGEKGAFSLLQDCTNATEAAEATAFLYRDYYGDSWADHYAEQAGLLWMRCGLNADIDDFVTHAGHSRVTYPPDIYDAAKRLTERVTLARATLNAQSNQADPGCTTAIAA